MARKNVTIDGKLVADLVADKFKILAEAFYKEFGLTLHIRSGLRTLAEQQELYKKYLNGTGNLAAKPGTSRHEKGNALDIYDSGSDAGVTRSNNKRSNWIKKNASKYGFKANGYTFKQVEPWHIEYTGKYYWYNDVPQRQDYYWYKDATQKTVAHTKSYQVTANKLNARKGPGTHFDIAKTRDKGFTFNPTVIEGSWVKAKAYWYHTSYLKEVKTPTPKPVPVPVLKPTTRPPVEVKVRVGSLNIPLDSAKIPDGKNRAKYAAKQIVESNLDVLGLQELDRGASKVAHIYANQLLKELNAIENVWDMSKPTTPYNENYTFYRKNKVTLKNRYNDTILSSAVESRHLTFNEFEIKGITFNFLNTHLVNGKNNDIYREFQSDQIADKVKNYKDITILVGDFNMPYMSKELIKVGFHSARLSATATANIEYASYAKYGKQPSKNIADNNFDHILSKGHKKVNGFNVKGIEKGKFIELRPSDHQLIIASITL